MERLWPDRPAHLPGKRSADARTGAAGRAAEGENPPLALPLPCDARSCIGLPRLQQTCSVFSLPIHWAIAVITERVESKTPERHASRQGEECGAAPRENPPTLGTLASLLRTAGRQRDLRHGAIAGRSQAGRMPRGGGGGGGGGAALREGGGRGGAEGGRRAGGGGRGGEGGTLSDVGASLDEDLGPPSKREGVLSCCTHGLSGVSARALSLSLSFVMPR